MYGSNVHTVMYMSLKLNIFHEYMFIFLLFSLNIQDIQGDEFLRDLQKQSMGIYVINQEGGEMGHYDDIGIFVEGLIILDNCGSVAQACAIMLGVIYTLWIWLTPKS